MLDAYIIDQIKKREEEERRRRQGDQPTLEYPLLEGDPDEEDEKKDTPDRGVVIIDLALSSLQSKYLTNKDIFKF